jgi:hypothetical protein
VLESESVVKTQTNNNNNNVYIVTYFLKVITMEPEKQPLLGYGSENMPVARL